MELALDVESRFPLWLHRRLMRKCYKLAPNRQGGSLNKLLSLESTYMSSESIAKALDPPLVSPAVGAAATGAAATGAADAFVALCHPRVQALMILYKQVLYMYNPLIYMYMYRYISCTCTYMYIRFSTFSSSVC